MSCNLTKEMQLVGLYLGHKWEGKVGQNKQVRQSVLTEHRRFVAFFCISIVPPSERRGTKETIFINAFTTRGGITPDERHLAGQWLEHMTANYSYIPIDHLNI